MAKTDFIKKPKNRDFMTLPSVIFEDDRVSVGAKGLYAQLYYSSSMINSLEELTEFVSDTKEELDAYFDELVKIGYISLDKKGNAEFNIKTQNERTVAKKLNEAQVDKFKNSVKEQPKKLNAYEKLIALIQSYKLDPRVENLLITYFERWLNKKGRFAEAGDLHGYIARSKINDLISFHMSDDDMITCIQTSIDLEWFKFVDQRAGSQPKAADRSSHIQFDKTNLTSGSYSSEDIRQIKERAEELEASGKKGKF